MAVQRPRPTVPPVMKTCFDLHLNPGRVNFLNNTFNSTRQLPTPPNQRSNSHILIHNPFSVVIDSKEEE
eukprot:m.28697 g.28697  ORF g.28697 m.28697 type:complete len:69 (+) comp9493_c0_seq5:1104-1310(+)